MCLEFTWTVCSSVSEVTADRYRWCFDDQLEPVIFFAEMEDFDDEPKLRESLKGHRYADRPLFVLHDEQGYAR